MGRSKKVIENPTPEELELSQIMKRSKDRAYQAHKREKDRKAIKENKDLRKMLDDARKEIQEKDKKIQIVTEEKNLYKGLYNNITKNIVISLTNEQANELLNNK